MTPEQIEIHRKRFEEVCGFHLTSAQKEHGDKGYYAQPWANDMLKGYLLCAENMPAVELPKPHCAQGDDLNTYQYYTAAMIHYELDAAGIKYNIKE